MTFFQGLIAFFQSCIICNHLIFCVEIGEASRLRCGRRPNLGVSGEISEAIVSVFYCSGMSVHQHFGGFANRIGKDFCGRRCHVQLLQMVSRSTGQKTCIPFRRKVIIFLSFSDSFYGSN